MGKPIKFSKYFGVDSKKMDEIGALDIFISFDNPLFIDPFLLSISKEYKGWYKNIVEYLIFLKINNDNIKGKGAEKAYFSFHEIKETHLGYIQGNSDKGSGLGPKFVRELRHALKYLEQSTDEDIRIEKLTLFTKYVGRDKISDFITNLVLSDIAKFTENVCNKGNIVPEKTKNIIIQNCFFDKSKKIRLPKSFKLPIYNGKYILLMPEVILTTTDDFLNKKDFNKNLFNHIPQSLQNDELKFKFNLILKQEILTKEEKLTQLLSLVIDNPDIYKTYTEIKEKDSSSALKKNKEEINEHKDLLAKIPTINSFRKDFNPDKSQNSLEEAYRLIAQFKQKIEENGLYKTFYKNDKDIFSEKQIQLLFTLSWGYSKFCVDGEVDNGSGPVDFKVSKGANNTTIIEFKLGSNSRLEHGLTTQSNKYGKTNNTVNIVRVVFCSSNEQIERTEEIIKTHNLKNVIMIDIQKQKSASKI
ncbi:MAG: hypothetical protein WC010_02625 [Candidatus Absconditabacterales bacterium]